MKLHQLRAFDAVIKTGAIRAAARHLDISPTAVTKALRELETAIGTPLLAKHSKSFSLTEAGRALKVHAATILKQLERADEELRTIRGERTGKLSLGVTPWVALTLLPATVTKFRQRMPEVTLEFYEGLLAVVQPLLRDGSLDFCIGRRSLEWTHSQYSNVPVFSSEAAVVARTENPYRHCRSLRELEDAEWLLSWDTAEQSSMLERLFRQHGMRVPTIHLAHSVSVGYGMLAHTDMLGVYPWPLVEAGVMGGGLTALPLRDTINETTVCITSRKDSPMSTAAQCFLECFKETVAEMKVSQDPRQKRLYNSIDVLF